MVNNLIERSIKPKQLMKLIDYLIQNKKQITRVKFITKKSYHYSIQPDVLKTNDSYSNILALPLEVYLPENMSSNLRGETIPMACSCFFRGLRNIQEEDLVHSIQNIGLKQIFVT
jgi:hypothetical protein